MKQFPKKKIIEITIKSRISSVTLEELENDIIKLIKKRGYKAKMEDWAGREVTTKYFD